VVQRVHTNKNAIVQGGGVTIRSAFDRRTDNMLQRGFFWPAGLRW
jgi:hypothetical protein